MKYLGVLVVLAGVFAPTSLASDQTANMKIMQLESKVRQLEATVRTLEMDAQRMKRELADLKKNTATSTTCAEQEEKLSQQRNVLLKSGLSSTHPDVASLDSKLHAIRQECTDTPVSNVASNNTKEASECRQFINKLLAQRDELFAIGFTENHPDIKKTDARISEAELSCP